MLDQKLNEFTGRDVVKLVVVLYCLRGTVRFSKGITNGIAKGLNPSMRKLNKMLKEKSLRERYLAEENKRYASPIVYRKGE